MFQRRLPTLERTPGGKASVGRAPNHSSTCHPVVMKSTVLIVILGSYLIPFFIIPTTVHPFMGWGTFLLGSSCFLIVTINIFQLRPLAVLTPWLAVVGMLIVMVWPYHTSGITRTLVVTAYACLATPLLWWSGKEVTVLVDQSAEREPLMVWTNGRSDPSAELSKLC